MTKAGARTGEENVHASDSLSSKPEAVESW
jgi:hypothetical protein